MCTSYALRERDERIVTREFGCLVLHFEERPKIAPPQRAPVVLVNDGHLVCMEMGWGVKQHWSERLIVNAQWETLSLRPTFIRAFRTHRCLLPASGFYRPTAHGRRHSILFSPANRSALFFGGLWFADNSGGNFLIITAATNRATGPSQRTPFIVTERNSDAWLKPNGDAYEYVQSGIVDFKPVWG